MLLGLSTGHAVGLAVVAGAFVVFALVSSLVIPRWRPDFPGRNLRWFLVATVVLFVATLGAVEVFAKEPEEATEVETTSTSTEPAGTTTQAAEPPPAPAGNAAAGKEVFTASGCGSCHAFSKMGSTGTVGPDLDEALQGKPPEFIRESIVDPNKEIAPGFPPNVMPQTFGDQLTRQQIDDLVALLQVSPNG